LQGNRILVKENKSIKVYIDNCVFSKLLRGTIDDKEQLKALEKIYDCDYINLVVSEEIFKEFVKTKEDNIRIALKLFYKLIKKIDTANIIRFEGGWSFPWKFPITFGTAVKEKNFLKLKNIFKNGDEVHIYNAIKADCKYFLTLDYKTVLNKIKNDRVQMEIKGICPNLKFVDPKELLEKLL
jgi:hypothetical protein